MSENFFELLQVAIGQRSELTSQPSAEEWAQLYEECERQSLIGIGFVGITRLPANQRPQKAQLVQWVQDAQEIKEKNERMTKMCGVVSQQFTHDGFWNYILKGQSNLPNYPIELRNYRNPGDIDIWVCPTGNHVTLRQRRKQIVRYVRERIPKGAKYECEYRYKCNSTEMV